MFKIDILVIHYKIHTDCIRYNNVVYEICHSFLLWREPFISVNSPETYKNDRHFQVFQIVILSEKEKKNKSNF